MAMTVPSGGSTPTLVMERPIDLEIAKSLRHLGDIAAMLDPTGPGTRPETTRRNGKRTLKFSRPGLGTGLIEFDEGHLIIGLRSPGEQSFSDVVMTSILRKQDGSPIENPKDILSVVMSALRSERRATAAEFGNTGTKIARKASIRTCALNGVVDPVDTMLIPSTIMGPASSSIRIVGGGDRFHAEGKDVEAMERTFRGIMSVSALARGVMLEPFVLTDRYLPDGHVGLMRDMSSID